LAVVSRFLFIYFLLNFFSLNRSVSDMRMEPCRQPTPVLSYIHVVEPRVDGGSTRTDVPTNESNDFIRDIVREKGQGTKFISAGGYTRESAIEAADVKGDFVAFGRWFSANASNIVI
jgi:2,4-dienoyl-CoA reductase-like NADH-dependent reductase (Old Yellow Enzyme family)